MSTFFYAVKPWHQYVGCFPPSKMRRCRFGKIADTPPPSKWETFVWTASLVRSQPWRDGSQCRRQLCLTRVSPQGAENIAEVQLHHHLVGVLVEPSLPLLWPKILASRLAAPLCQTDVVQCVALGLPSPPGGSCGEWP